MIIKPSKGFDIKKYNLPDDELEVMYGLPKEIKYCSSCNISNQQPMSSNEYEHNKESKKVTIGF